MMCAIFVSILHCSSWIVHFCCVESAI